MSGTGIEPERVVRREIQFLRAFAVLVVVGNHAWPHLLPGGFLGVDVFFLISGFLITSQLLTAQSGAGIRLGDFWRKRARRLLPASLLVVAASIGLALLWLPPTLWPGTLRDAIASSLYAENWALAADSVDYFASSNAPSILQHYWSLSVEEQFYLIWPFLLIGAAFLAVRLGHPERRRRAVIIVVGTVTALSLAASIAFSASAGAYFNTGIRAWEFGLGALLAALAPLAPLLPERARRWPAWLGWTVLLAVVVLLPAGLPTPGAVAVVPLAAAAAVMIAGSGGVPRSRIGTLVTRPIEWVGTASYSIYLWHWPLLVVAPFVLARPIGARDKIVIIAATLVLAGLTRRFVEDPVRRSHYLRAGRARQHLWLAAATVVLVGSSAVGLTVIQAQADASAATAASPECRGAAAMRPGADCPRSHDRPSDAAAIAASTDFQATVTHGSSCIQERDPSDLRECEFGIIDGSAVRTVALVGDSHAGHWLAAIDQVAEAERWRVVDLMKSSCPAVLEPTATASWYPAGAASCHEWTAAMVARVADDPGIDVVIFSTDSRDYVQGAGGTESLSAKAYRDTWEVWLAAGKTVVILADTPHWGLGDLPTCIAASTTDDPCATSLAVLDGDPMVAAVALRPDPALLLVDMNDFFCDDRLCHPVVGGVVAIGDANHMTVTFAETLGPFLRERLVAALAGSG